MCHINVPSGLFVFTAFLRYPHSVRRKGQSMIKSTKKRQYSKLSPIDAVKQPSKPKPNKNIYIPLKYWSISTFQLRKIYRLLIYLHCFRVKRTKRWKFCWSHASYHTFRRLILSMNNKIRVHITNEEFLILSITFFQSLFLCIRIYLQLFKIHWLFCRS